MYGKSVLGGMGLIGLLSCSTPTDRLFPVSHFNEKVENDHVRFVREDDKDGKLKSATLSVTGLRGKTSYFDLNGDGVVDRISVTDGRQPVQYASVEDPLLKGFFMRGQNDFERYLRSINQFPAEWTRAEEQERIAYVKKMEDLLAPKR